MHVLWDFDNTLAQCKPIWPATFNDVAGPLGEPIRTELYRRWQSTFPWMQLNPPYHAPLAGEGYYEYLARTLADALSSTGTRRTVRAVDVRGAVLANMRYTLFDGASDALDASASRGHTNHLASNHVADLVDVLAELDLQRCFHHVFISGEIRHEKPSAAFWERIEDTIKADRSEVAMVGDDYARDIEPTAARGYHAIWVASPEKRAGVATHGVRVADSIAAVPALLQEISL